MKHTTKILALVFVALMILTSLSTLGIHAEEGTTLYLKPNANWLTQGHDHDPRFAAYFFNDTGYTWVDMTEVEDGVYSVVVPEGYTNVIFCRMNGNTTINKWNETGDETKYIYDQTADLIVPTDGTNCYQVAEDAWSKGDGTWSTYTPTIACTHTFANYDKKAPAYSTFTTTFPTATTKGCTTLTCTTCGKAVSCGDVSAMTPGTYVLDAKDFEGIAKEDYINGQVKVVNDVFAAHLNTNYKTDTSVKTFNDGSGNEWKSTHRMNFGGKSEIISQTDAYKNYIEITTTSDTTITIWWTCGGNGRQVIVIDKDGKTEKVSTETTTESSLYITTFEVEAGTHFIGTDCTGASKAGGNYFYKIQVVVAEPTVHNHDWADATCTTPKTCNTCGETEGNALGHDMADATCTSSSTCRRENCGHTEGNALGHTGGTATCTEKAICTRCSQPYGDALGHDYVDGVCSRCNDIDPSTIFYLVGYINGADCGCGDDYAALHDEYKFVDGKLTVTFIEDSYVFIKTADNAHWYLFEAYVTEKTGTLVENQHEKMFVPKDIEVTFTLVVNEDETLTLSYTVSEQSGEENPGEENPGEENPGEETPGEENPGEENPGEETPGEENPGEENPGEENPGEETPGEENPGEENPGEETPGEENPGEENPGEENPGEETPDEPTDDPAEELSTGSKVLVIIKGLFARLRALFMKLVEQTMAIIKK